MWGHLWVTQRVLGRDFFTNKCIYIQHEFVYIGFFRSTMKRRCCDLILTFYRRTCLYLHCLNIDAIMLIRLRRKIRVENFEFDFEPVSNVSRKFLCIHFYTRIYRQRVCSLNFHCTQFHDNNASIDKRSIYSAFSFGVLKYIVYLKNLVIYIQKKIHVL